MNNYGDLIIYNESGVSDVKGQDFPSYLEASINKITDLDQKYRLAKQKVEEAKKDVEKATKVAEDAKKKSSQAKENADIVKNQNSRFGHHTKAIDALNQSQSNIADSQKDLADAVVEVSKTQKLLAKAQENQMDAIRGLSSKSRSSRVNART